MILSHDHCGIDTRFHKAIAFASLMSDQITKTENQRKRTGEKDNFV